MAGIIERIARFAARPRVGRGRRAARRLEAAADRLVAEPRIGWGLTISLLFVGACTLLVIWAREQPLVAVGRVMNQTQAVRVSFAVEDSEATAKAREEMRLRTPRVYVADTARLESVRSELERLPNTLASAQSLGEVDDGIVHQFGLTEESLLALQGQVFEGEPSESWMQAVDEFVRLLTRRPILDEQSFQRSAEGLHTRIKLIVGSEVITVPRTEILNIADARSLREAVEMLARDARLRDGPLRAVVVNRVVTDPAPSYRADDAGSTRDQDTAAASIRPVISQRPAGQVIFRRGDVLTAPQLELYRAEIRHFASSAPAIRIWGKRLGLCAAVAAVTLAIAGYAALYAPRIRRNASRMTGVALLLALTLGAACVATAADASLAALTVVTPSVFLAVILSIAYDRRIALAFATLHGVLVCLALDQPIGTYAVIITGVGTSIWVLKEVRDRGSLLRVALSGGVAMALATMLIGMIERPLVDKALRETFVDAGLAGAGGLLVGGVTLFILPWVERTFDIVTGMTLMELRDPKQPLLRELQRRAPGTYNHSLNVASIAESAAEAVGGNSLLTYVGALYHDVGKMNKPEYFVENRTGGPNKHDKLSPAMSLLIIVGHVKDGLELAREYGLPRSIQHFIESHHGTTLVEYFYHRARKQAIEAAKGEVEAEVDPAKVPDEFEYRYPGPKPATREAAILMLSDVVESMTRTLAEPTPSRIDALVRSVANKRLLDGQFDECELTFRELQTIVESISRTVASIYHGRIVYPTSEPEEKRA